MKKIIILCVCLVLIMATFISCGLDDTCLEKLLYGIPIDWPTYEIEGYGYVRLPENWEISYIDGFAYIQSKENGEIKLLIQSYPQFIAILNLNQSLKKGKAVFDERFSFVSDSAVAIMARSNVVYKIGDKFLMNRAPDRIKGLENFNASYQWFDYAEDSPGESA